MKSFSVIAKYWYCVLAEVYCPVFACSYYESKALGDADEKGHDCYNLEGARLVAAMSTS